MGRIGVGRRTAAAVAEAERWTAHNYHPLPVVIADGDGAWVTDVDGAGTWTASPATRP
jgi:acetylornithine/succinyldiaminopimelate/putrescine aminotransferase